MKRRIVLGLGAALLVGGWGTTRYADEQQQTEPGIRNGKLALWVSGEAFGRETRVIPSRVIYGTGIIGMAIGAGLIGFGILRPTNHN